MAVSQKRRWKSCDFDVQEKNEILLLLLCITVRGILRSIKKQVKFMYIVSCAAYILLQLKKNVDFGI